VAPVEVLGLAGKNSGGAVRTTQVTADQPGTVTCTYDPARQAAALPAGQPRHDGGRHAAGRAGSRRAGRPLDVASTNPRSSPSAAPPRWTPGTRCSTMTAATASRAREMAPVSLGQRETTPCCSQRDAARRRARWFEQGDVCAKVAALRPATQVDHVDSRRTERLSQAMRRLMTTKHAPDLRRAIRSGADDLVGGVRHCRPPARRPRPRRPS
jgi:hypothetical protein